MMQGRRTRWLVLSFALMASSLAAAGGGGSAAAGGGTDWPTYGFDTLRTGFNPAETTLGVSNVGGLTQKWTNDLGAVTIAQPAVASGVIVNGSPTDVVYTGSEHGHLVALNAASGTKLWDSGTTITANIYAAPTLVNGMLFVGAWDKKLHAYGL